MSKRDGPDGAECIDDMDLDRMMDEVDYKIGQLRQVSEGIQAEGVADAAACVNEDDYKEVKQSIQVCATNLRGDMVGTYTFMFERDEDAESGDTFDKHTSVLNYEWNYRSKEDDSMFLSESSELCQHFGIVVSGTKLMTRKYATM